MKKMKTAVLTNQTWSFCAQWRISSAPQICILQSRYKLKKEIRSCVLMTVRYKVIPGKWLIIMYLFYEIFFKALRKF